MIRNTCGSRLTFMSTVVLLCSAWGAGFPILDLSRLELKNGKAESVTHKAKPALKMMEKEAGLGEAFAIAFYRQGEIGVG